MTLGERSYAARTGCGGLGQLGADCNSGAQFAAAVVGAVCSVPSIERCLCVAVRGDRCLHPTREMGALASDLGYYKGGQEEKREKKS